MVQNSRTIKDIQENPCLTLFAQLTIYPFPSLKNLMLSVSKDTFYTDQQI